MKKRMTNTDIITKNYNRIADAVDVLYQTEMGRGEAYYDTCVQIEELATGRVLLEDNYGKYVDTTKYNEVATETEVGRVATISNVVANRLEEDAIKHDKFAVEANEQVKKIMMETSAPNVMHVIYDANDIIMEILEHEYCEDCVPYVYFGLLKTLQELSSVDQSNIDVYDVIELEDYEDQFNDTQINKIMHMMLLVVFALIEDSSSDVVDLLNFTFKNKK